MTDLGITAPARPVGRRLDPRELAAAATIDQLIEALADPDDPMAVQRVEERDGSAVTYFRCPHCAPARDSHLGTAYVTDYWRWSCSRCRCDGTRFTLEDGVLAGAERIRRLVDIIRADRRQAKS